MDSKLPDVEGKTPSDELQRTTSVTSDAKGNTIIIKVDGETFTIDEKAERALVRKFDLRILPLLATMYLVRSNSKPCDLAKCLADISAVQRTRQVKSGQC